MRRALPYVPIAAVLAFGAALRLWNLSANGYSREYYAAAVRSMLQSWHNTFFNSFDPGGFVTLDKPPVAIWFQALFAKLFGFNALNTLLPQVVLGLAAIFLVYLIVRRCFSERAALTAALILAVSPGNVAVDRSNNLESCLIAVLLLAVYLGIRAAETGRLRYFIAAMLVIGVGFNVKMAAAWVLAPTIALAFFAFNRQHSLARHTVYQAVAGTLMLALSLSWVIAFDLTPANQRPYAGSTKNNSMLELVLKHNGTDRFTAPATTKTASTVSNEPQPELYDTSPTGPLRLFRALQAGQFAWLLPLAIAGIVLGWRASTASREQHITIAVSTGWLASYWIVFSAAGGPFHTYYLAALSPPLAALAGIGASEAWKRYRSGEGSPLLVPLLLLVTVSWQAWLFYGQTGTSAPVWLLAAAGTALLFVVLSVCLFVLGAMATRPALTVIPAVALLALPLAAALSVVIIRPNVVAPVVTLAEYIETRKPEDAIRRDPRQRDFARVKLTAFLSEQYKQEKFLVAVENALIAGPIIIATGKPVMAVGGYLGTDPILTPEALAALAARSDVRFVMTGGLSLTKRNQPGEIAIREWVQKNGSPVDPVLWSATPQLAGKTFRIRMGGVLTEMAYPELYDLRPIASR
jgi:4-amino-4-deoxy-L-arabinose transferase-like glycosyltransferase